MMNKYIIVFILVLLSGCASQLETPVQQVRNDHPIIGKWRLDRHGCTEAYVYHTNGTRDVISNDETLKASFTISDTATAKGYYFTKDTVLEDNGKRDCAGSTADMTGKVVSRYIRFNDDQTKFVFCVSQDSSQCVGPFVKVKAFNNMLKLPSSIADVSDQQIGMYRQGIKTGCENQRKEIVSSKDSANSYCSCMVKALDGSMSHSEWQQAYFYSVNDQFPKTMRILKSHSASIQHCN